MSIITRLTKLELHAKPRRGHMTIYTCGAGIYWRPPADDTGAFDYRLCIHGLNAAGECVPPTGADVLTQNDVDALGVRFTVMVVQYVHNWHMSA